MKAVIAVEGMQSYESDGGDSLMCLVLNSELERAIRLDSSINLGVCLYGYVLVRREVKNGVLYAEMRRG